jgi:hypothetical protein
MSAGTRTYETESDLRISGKDLAFAPETLKYIDVDQASTWTAGLGADGKNLDLKEEEMEDGQITQGKTDATKRKTSLQGDLRRVLLLQKVTKGSRIFYPCSMPTL